MDRDRDKMAERILHLTLEILFRLTGENYTVVKKTSSDHCQAPVFEGFGRHLSPITGPSPHPLIHEDINDQKILELTYKMIELLTGEVPIRCQDVAVYFSMEEWEYLEGHKDLYKDVMMEVPQPLTSPDLSRKRTTPEGCPHPLLPQDFKQEDPNVPQDHQGEDMTHINTIETYVIGDELCKEAIPTDNGPDDCSRTEGHLIASIFKSDYLDIKQDIFDEHVIVPAAPSTLHSKDLSTDPFKKFLSSNSSQSVKKNKRRKRGKTQSAVEVKKPSSSSELGRGFSLKTYFVTHKKMHRGEKPFSCSECEKSFNRKSVLLRHERVHIRKKPFLCLDCGNCFNRKSSLVRHQRIHTGEKPFLCPECGKYFRQKSYLLDHVRTHTGEKPFSCPECGKCFNRKSILVIHQRSHTGEKPYLCSKCGKCFSQKSNLVTHQKTHPG
ncbi:uncharacterized protein LOC143767501 [Ranitomeya variabilis]|uniref:uncharacterized protein LOC143767501 n=1 Tax=Ranitomeya variabilis TaxID=490064 RepID=UPI0040579B90